MQDQFTPVSSLVDPMMEMAVVMVAMVMVVHENKAGTKRKTNRKADAVILHSHHASQANAKSAAFLSSRPLLTATRANPNSAFSPHIVGRH